MPPTRTVLITGCSDGSLGAALAQEFHSTGTWRVFASARNSAKLSAVRAAGIETILIDVASTASIQAAVETVSKLTSGSLDALVNNAGVSTAPVAALDLDIAAGKRLFDVNVWGVVETVQAFMPLLLKAAAVKEGASKESSAMIVNHCSAGAVLATPMLSSYAASKTALLCFTETMRRELAPFGVGVVALMTGVVRSQIQTNAKGSGGRFKLPEGSIYGIAREAVEKGMDIERFYEEAPSAEDWAREVVRELTKDPLPAQIWKGKDAGKMWAMQFPPRRWMDGMVAKLTGMDVVGEKIKEERSKNTEGAV
ncbi:hypothetical protein DV737_g1548, partial [Chaetothyriales sp. CBS 132003]